MYTSLTVAAALVLGAPALKDREPLGKGPGYLGVTFQQDEGGMVVTDVKPDSPAAKGGVRVNDLMVKLDGVSLADAETGDLVKMVAGMRPGTVVKLEVRRGSETVTLKVKLGPRPADFQPTPRLPPIIDDPKP
jgi:S1-C subfamily serine protease